VEAAADGPERRPRPLEERVLERRLDRLGAGVREGHHVIAEPPAQRLGQRGRSGPDRRLRLERSLLVEAAARDRHEVRMVMAEQVGAVAADQIQDRHEPAAAPQPQGVTLAALVHRVEADGGQQAHDGGAAVSPVLVDGARRSYLARPGLGDRRQTIGPMHPPREGSRHR
jgi:hypothetical protein